MTLDEIETRLRGRAADFASLNVPVKFDFGAEGALWVDATKRPPAVSRTGEAAETTIVMALPDFAKMLDGKLSPMWAFTTGKLKVKGSTALAMKLAALLDE
jgi:putative sterol carrier protein